ncbi:MAG: guanylate kinase [Clostridia bacterium]|nr:guanylate kinase [Clostridia bacterium]
MNKGLLFIVSGPSGAGKGTICEQVLARTGMVRSVSVTTRAKREHEQEGLHYFFRTEEQYRQMIADGEFFETAEVFNHFYGTPKAPVLDNLEKGIDVLCEIDVHGAASIKKQYPDAVSVFVMTPDFDVLAERLRGRGTETEASLKTRLGSAKRELGKFKLYDYIVFNDTIDDAVEQMLDIVTAEKCKVKNNLDKIAALLGK